MEIIKTLLWVVQIVSAISVVILVLLQQGKGADAGATFGSSGSASLFGASGSANFLSRTTAVLATVFFVVTLTLVIIASKGRDDRLGVMGNINTAPVTIVESSVGAKLPEANSKVIESKVQIPD